MNPVITSEQAKQITGGRTPLVPVEYESAVKALQACSTLDEAKYWDNKADALAAWARIYRNDQAGLEAKRLKLHAYRRMGILAEEIRPHRKVTHRGTTPGPPSLLREVGLSANAAGAARRLTKVSDQRFAEIAGMANPPSPIGAQHLLKDSSKAWALVARYPRTFRSFCRGHDAVTLARALAPDEALKAGVIVLELIEWLDAFEQALPKAKK